MLSERAPKPSWRFHRVTRYKTAIIALYQERTEGRPGRRRRYGNLILGAHHPEDVRNNLKAARSKHRFLKRLPKLDADKHVSTFDADTTLWTVVEYADRVAEGEVDSEEVLEGLSVPVVPDDVDWEFTRAGLLGRCERA